MEYVSRGALPNETVMDYSLLGGEHIRRGRRLYLTGLGLLAVALVYLGSHANVSSELHLFQGLVIFVLSVLPSLFWAKTGGSRFPAFEAIMVLCANAYAMPLLNARDQLEGYSDDVISRAGWAVILYLVTANVTYRMTRGLPGRSRFWRESLITNQVEKLMVYGMVVSTIYVAATVFTTWIPRELESTLRAVFYGVGILCTFVSSQRWGRGELNQTEKAVFVCTLVPQLFFMSVSLVLINAFTLIGIALLGYLSGGKRIPWFTIAVTFVILAVLHTGKTRMREKYWDGQMPGPTFTQLYDYYAEWIDFGLQPTSGGKTVSQKMIERTSLMHILCLICSYTPDRQDYLYGSTYVHVLPQLIPRFFWPEKPRSHIATYELSIYYGLQREEDTNNTTIAFGLLAEAFANFGFAGSVLLGLFWGYVYRKFQIWSTFSPMFSFAGLFMILLTAWSLSAELTMAAWVSSFEQAVIVVLGLPLLVRGLFGN
ncbi:MAG TPA: hypothetical protein VG734_22715 [Lacunisphaera sp.]|nr:hypothetical protein [Lacunisphaera sp.]